MLVVDENSLTFQKDVFFFLLKAIVEHTQKDPVVKQKKIKEIEDYIHKNKIDNIDSLIQHSKNLVNILKISENSLREFIQKNYFKSIQSIKKQKEELNTFLTSDTKGLISVLSLHIFKKDLSNAHFRQEQDQYVLYLPNSKIYESGASKETNNVNNQMNNIEDIETKKYLKKDLKENIVLEEKSIIIEILEKFSNILKVQDISSKMRELENSLNHSVDTNELSLKEEKNEKSSPTIMEESIIIEILNRFSEILPVRYTDLQKEFMKIESISLENTGVNITQNNNTIQENPIEIIPYTINEYFQLRKKIQYYKSRNDTEGYQKFFSSLDKRSQACIGILNIIYKENQIPIDTYLQKISNKLGFSVESLKELFNRIKKYNYCISFMKQASEYLKNQKPELYSHFLNIYEPLLDFISFLDCQNPEHFQNSYLEKNLKLLLISITEENIRFSLMQFLIQFLNKIKMYLN